MRPPSLPAEMLARKSQTSNRTGQPLPSGAVTMAVSEVGHAFGYGEPR